MEGNPEGSGTGGGPSGEQPPPLRSARRRKPSRYESQKRRDWSTFMQFLRDQSPPVPLSRCNGTNVVEFLEYMDQFGKTKVHALSCPSFGHPNSLDALIGRLRAAYEENDGAGQSNPFAAGTVRAYLRGVKESQARARGIPYKKKRRKKMQAPAAAGGASASSAPAPAP
ncbi:unnamed protein product [Spirodela intermedia]|uniref:ALOG domain-containing protein n=1 Tax=Spirodela intermedia TaxID=51605 RepID=A0A7I8IGS3_SPIIN|nr:unnamed protein product [Spirodela intermedia]CAA6656903.1 unnamed protein product [Spirodela intermedia]